MKARLITGPLLRGARKVRSSSFVPYALALGAAHLLAGCASEPADTSDPSNGSSNSSTGTGSTSSDAPPPSDQSNATNPGVTVPCSGAPTAIGPSEFKSNGHIAGVAHDATGDLWIGWTGQGASGGSHAFVAFEEGGAWTTKDRGRGSMESIVNIGADVAATTFAPGSPALAYFERYDGKHWYDDVDLKEYFSSSVASNASGEVAVAFVWTDVIGDRIGVDRVDGSKVSTMAPLFTPFVNPNEASCTLNSSALDAAGVVYVSGTCSSEIDDDTPFVAWSDGSSWSASNLNKQGAVRAGSISKGLDGSVTVAWQTIDGLAVAPLSSAGLGVVRTLDVDPGVEPLHLAMVDATHGYISLGLDHKGGIGKGVAYTYFDANGYLNPPVVVAQPGRDQTAIPRGISIDPTNDCPAIAFDAVLTFQAGTAPGEGHIVVLSTP